MDGFKKRLNQSVQRKLSFSLSLAILILAVIAGTFSFASAFDEAHELQDDMLRQIAALTLQPVLSTPAQVIAHRGKDSDEDARVIVQYLGNNKPAYAGGVALPLPVQLPDGMHTIKSAGDSFRVLVKTTPDGRQLVVAQETGVRDEIAGASALRTLMPLLILIPILLLIVADLVRKIFRPIALVSAELNQRADNELHPVAEASLPVEIRPFAVAINRLLVRVDQAMKSQRRFVADAAHELRTPLTALSLQAGQLAQTDMPALAQERLQTLRRGIERGRKLLEQLLSLTRAQAASGPAASSISVQQSYRRILENLMPLAQGKHIDLGVEGEQDAQLQISETDLDALIGNLVDNAIRYTPEGGKVDLSVSREGNLTVLNIMDNGPGIAPDERERVFEPFYRTLGSGQPGSGLGLSIVKTICERIGASIELGYADEMRQSGLNVRVLFPNPDRPQP